MSACAHVATDAISPIHGVTGARSTIASSCQQLAASNGSYRRLGRHQTSFGRTWDLHRIPLMTSRAADGGFRAAQNLTKRPPAGSTARRSGCVMPPPPRADWRGGPQNGAEQPPVNSSRRQLGRR